MSFLKRLWRPETGLFLAVWLVLLAGGRSRFLRDPGTFWHTVVGERILTSGEFIDRDPFSYTFAGTPWVPYQWLGEVGMAGLHRFGKLDALLLATVTILAGLFAWLGTRLMRAGLHWSLAASLVALALAASASHFHVRPHVLTLVFLGITFAALCDCEAGRLSPGQLFWLVPLFVVWTNTHGGMLGGLATLGLVVGGWAVAWLLGWPSPVNSVRRLAMLGGLMAACGLTAFVNPYGVRLPQTWAAIMNASLPTVIKEHAPPSWDELSTWMILFAEAAYLFVLLGVPPRRPRVVWLLPLVWFLMAWGRVRHAPLFAVVSLLAIADMFPFTRWADRLVREKSDLFVPPPPGPPPTPSERIAPWLLPAAAVLLAFGLQAERVEAPVVGRGWAQLDPSLWPVELVGELRHYQDARRGGTPIFNEFLYGGFLTYAAPGYRVFVDDRCELYGGDWLRAFVAADQHGTARYLLESQARYGRFDFALTTTGSGFDDYFRQSDEWELIRRTQTATFYRRAER